MKSRRRTAIPRSQGDTNLRVTPNNLLQHDSASIGSSITAAEQHLATFAATATTTACAYHHFQLPLVICYSIHSTEDSDLVPAPPRGEQWLHEVKFDGWRIQLHKHGSSSET
jgi:hypothetical protein